MLKKLENMSKVQLIYFFIIAFTALGLGLSNDVIANYFKDAYQITAYERGLIEFPRELPGVLVIFIVASLSIFSDVRIAMGAQLLSIIGIGALGFITPPFAIMLIFIFINSVGMHMFMPLQDSIGMSLIKNEGIGKKMGQYKGVSTVFTMLAGILVFIGFRIGFFSFKSNIKWIFIIAAGILVVVFILFFILEKQIGKSIKSNKKVNFVFRKEYRYYYTLVVMWGVQKQIMIVYGPWVLIDILNKRADTLAILTIIGSFVGVFFIPAVGRWVDRFGIKKLLYADALSFIVVYLVYGLLSAGFSTGTLDTIGIPLFLAYMIFIIDRMSTQMGMIRTIYLRSIAVKSSDITPTLSLGLSLDHIVSIICAYLGGVVWSLWGPQYIFFLASALSIVNLYVASKVREDKLTRCI
ncbi:MFS transporter [Marinisporobacter balticus]|uniref:Putative MFS family arabinose efflux permease n=1 Tax=Marinisporobacter balticus TaxID=2018667 RepID=A0A4R2L1P2_9FIRM|nr:MFS transporter [Marinisporobacter balticus]TCO79532.1 putative MFS family arabinose efflux permease [Marinisporobacter balticus]